MEDLLSFRFFKLTNSYIAAPLIFSAVTTTKENDRSI